METTPKFILGVFSFAGAGLTSPGALGAAASYTVPADKRSQLIYLRAGNSAESVVALSLMKDGALFRIFPVGAKAAMHVPLAVVEDLMPDSKLEVFVAAPSGTVGEIILDIGMIEI